VAKEGVASEDKVLSLQNFEEFVCLGSEDVFVPADTVTPSGMAGMEAQVEENLRLHLAIKI
jgi:hypothetical protein